MTALVLAFAPTVREQLERLGYWSLAGHVPDKHLPSLLARLAPHLDEDTALLRFRDLVDAVAVQDAFERGAAHWSEVVDDVGRDLPEQADDAARTHVSLALDALTGAAS